MEQSEHEPDLLQGDDETSSDEFHPSRRRRRRRRRRYRRIQAVAVLPSLFTLGNLIAGFAAIHYASKPMDGSTIGPLAWSPLETAGALIFIGMLCDAIDGSVARLTRTTSDIGAQLDSLADIVTFGVAPAYMTLRLVSNYYFADGAQTALLGPDQEDLVARVFWVIAAIYVCCSALRLARFNVETGATESVDQPTLFRGLPSPGAAGCLAALILFHQERLVELEIEWINKATGFGMPGIMLLCALAMVSRLPYVHVANRYVRGQAPFPYIVMMTIILVLVIFFPQEVLAIGFTLYTLSAPTRSLVLIWRKRTRRKGAGRSIATSNQ